VESAALLGSLLLLRDEEVLLAKEEEDCVEAVENKPCVDPDITSDRTHTHCSFLVDRPSPSLFDLLEEMLSNLLSEFLGAVASASTATDAAAAFRIDACTHNFILSMHC
jgi:hypothetical protein